MAIRDNLLSGEEIAFESKKHWIAPFRASLLPILLLVAAWIVGELSPNGDGIVGAVGNLLDIVKIGLVVYAVGAIAYNIVLWRTAEFAVTNMRVLREEGLISHRTSATLIESVTDVKSRVPFLGARLGYGDLVILTQSGGAGQDTFESITRPIAFRDEIMTRKAGAGHASAARPAAATTPAPRPAAPAGATPAGSKEALATLEHLAKLRDSGAITAEEYEAKKSDILARV